MLITCLHLLFLYGWLLAGSVRGDICLPKSGDVVICSDNKRCCNDNTECCEEPLSVGFIAAVSIGGFVVLSVVIIVIVVAVQHCKKTDRAVSPDTPPSGVQQYLASLPAVPPPSYQFVMRGDGPQPPHRDDFTKVPL